MQQQRCQFCRRQIDVEKLVLHELYCERNCVKCDLCGFMYDQTDKESHDEEFHKMETCPHCQKEFPDLKTHNCDYVPVNCPYCMLDQPLIKSEEHQVQCGSRTEKCDICNTYILLRNFQKHIQTCQQNKAKKEVDDFPTIKEAEIRRQNIQQRAEIAQKIPPKDTHLIREPPTQQNQYDRNAFKEQKQQQQAKFQPQKQDLISFPEKKEYAPQSNLLKQKEKIFSNKEEKIQEDKQFKPALEKKVSSRVPYESQGFTQISYPNQFESSTFKSGPSVKEYYESFKEQESVQKTNQLANQNTQQAPLKGYKEGKGRIQQPNPYQLYNQQQVQQNKNYEQDKQSSLIKQNQQKNYQDRDMESNQYQKYGNQIPKNDPDQNKYPTQQFQNQYPERQNNAQPSKFTKNNPDQKQNNDYNYQYKLDPQKQQNSIQNQQNSFQPEYRFEQQSNISNPQSTNQQQNWHQNPHNDKKEYFKNYPQFKKYEDSTQQFVPEQQQSNIRPQSSYLEQNKQQRMQIDRKEYQNIPKEVQQRSVILNQVYPPQQQEGSRFFVPQSNIISNQPSQYVNIRNPQALQQPKFIRIQEVPQEELPLPNDSVIARKFQDEENLGMTQSKIQLYRSIQEQYDQQRQKPQPQPKSPPKAPYQIPPQEEFNQLDEDVRNLGMSESKIQFHRRLYEDFEQSRHQPPSGIVRRPQSPPKITEQIPPQLQEEFNYMDEEERKLQLAILEGFERERLNRRP